MCAKENSTATLPRLRSKIFARWTSSGTPTEPLLDRVWALRENLTAYDAVYAALAEALDAILLTCDARSTRAPGVGKQIKLLRE